MPRALVLLPSTTYRAADFVAAAEALGVELVVASDRPPPFDMGDRYLHLDCSEPETAVETVLDLADRVGIDAVVAADDAGVVVAALAGTKLGLSANPPEATKATRNKLELRRRLAATEVPQPTFAALESDDDPAEVAAAVGYPVVVKPLDRAASQGVIRADDAASVTAAVHRIREIVDSEEASLIVEAYTPGPEVAVEGLVHDGELTVLALFDKPDTPEGPYFPETILITPSRLPEDVQTECVRVAGAAVRGLGLVHGPVHIELKVEGERVVVIEVAARSIGGLCSRSLSFGLMGTTLESLILSNALGPERPRLRRQPTASGVLMIPIPYSGTLAGVEGVAETREIEGVTGIDLTFPPGTRIAPPPEGDRYLGFVFARGETPEDVEAALRRAAKTLEVKVDPR
ncbi:MAG: ATP-grasp domain-containing protein [Acidimicrobiia bacterium]